MRTIYDRYGGFTTVRKVVSEFYDRVLDIFGPGVNLAARMEALSDPMQTTITQETYDLIHEDFICTDLGEVEVKGFGTQRIYSLDGEWDRRR